MRGGVVGAGVVVRNHLRTYRQIHGVGLAGIADTGKKRPDSLSKEYNAHGYLDYHELLKNGMDAAASFINAILCQEYDVMATILRGYTEIL